MRGARLLCLRRAEEQLQHSSALAVLLACPLDGTSLSDMDGKLVCEQKHEFQTVDGVPVFTEQPRREYEPQNMPSCAVRESEEIDPFVSNWIVNTNGNLYWKVRGNLPRYPVPRWPFDKGNGKIVVDLGCGWGRWCLAAADAGFSPVGVDVHLDAVQAATRVAKQNEKGIRYLCADIERLPFRRESVDRIFSYSVLQHLDREKVARILGEAFRVLKPGGDVGIQLPNSRGLLSMFQQLRRGFREARRGTFEMRYWSSRQIQELFTNSGFQGTKLSADGFFSQNPQLNDLDLLSVAGRCIVLMSYAGSALSRTLRPLVAVADSLWVTARKPESKAS